MRKPLVALILMGLAGAPALQAREIKLPLAKPVLSLDIPDSWKTDMTDLGLESSSPENDTMIVAKILVRSKDDPNAWVKQALATFESRGVTFETKTTLAPKPAAPAAAKPVDGKSADAAVAKKVEPDATGPVADAKPADKAGEAKPAEATMAATAPAAAAPHGADETKGNEAAKGDEAAKAPRATAAEQELKAPPISPPMLSNQQFAPSMALNADIKPFAPPAAPAAFVRHALTYKGTSRDGKPVDVELVTYILPDKAVFFFLQESGKTDSRVIDIINSVKPSA